MRVNARCINSTRRFYILIFTGMPGESYRRQHRSLLLYFCHIFRVLINSLVCWSCPSTPGLVLFQIRASQSLKQSDSEAVRVWNSQIQRQSLKQSDSEAVRVRNSHCQSEAVRAGVRNSHRLPVSATIRVCQSVRVRNSQSVRVLLDSLGLRLCDS